MEETTWEELKKLDPEKVAKKANVFYNSKKQQYELFSLGKPYVVSLLEKKVWSSDFFGEFLLKRLSYLMYPVFLWYLIKAEGRKPNKDFLSYRSLRGGETFFRGSHQLPLQKLVERFESSPESLEQTARLLDGERFLPGDLAYKFFPLPHLPVVVTFWQGEENIPASGNFLFESQAQDFLPLDILWAIAMYVCQAFIIASDVK